MLVAATIFVITIVLVIIQPKGLPFGTTAVIGAIATLLFGVVTLNDVIIVTNIVWDATLAFIGIILLSMLLDEIGFFEWAALKMAHLSKGNGKRMFVYSLLLGSFVSIFFANDGAALILTPIILAKMRILKLDTKTIFAFVMAGGFISDTASLPLVISNLTNIVTAGYFGIGFFEYLKNMLLPTLISISASIVVLYLFFKKEIPQTIDTSLLKNPKSAIKHEKLFKISWYFLGLLLFGYFIGDALNLPVSLFALGGAFFFLVYASKYKAVKVWLTIKSAPWQVVWFSIGLYVVVYGLKNAGITSYLSDILEWLKTYPETIQNIGVGFIAAILSAIMNNMPTVMIMDIALHDAGLEALAYANVIGCNLGPKMTPIGSLATLLWLHVLAKKGVQISWLEYTKIGLIITPPVLLLTLLGV